LFDFERVVDVDGLKVSRLLKIASVVLNIFKADHPLNLAHFSEFELSSISTTKKQSSFYMPQSQILILPDHKSQLLIAQITRSDRFPQTSHKKPISMVLRYLDDLAVAS